MATRIRGQGPCRRAVTMAMLVTMASPHIAMARTWKDIQLLHSFETPLQVVDLDFLFSPTDPLGTPAPTGPTFSPTLAPITAQPTLGPTSLPTRDPTLAPTASPTMPPTNLPTDVPDPYPSNEPPDNPDPWYFNYDTRPEAQYGPGYPGILVGDAGFSVSFKNNGWTYVENPPDFYWKEFSNDGFGPWVGTLDNHIPDRNRCHNVGMQSPIDVAHNNLGVCHEHHEVRSLTGDYRITGNKVAKKIESNKLRLVFDRRPCKDLKNVDCQGMYIATDCLFLIFEMFCIGQHHLYSQ